MDKLVEQSELTKRTVYDNLAQGKAIWMDIETLEKTLSVLEVIVRVEWED